MVPLVSSVSQLPAESDPAALETGFQTASFYGSFVQVIITLAVIIGIIILLIRFLARKNKIWSGERSIRVLGGVALGQNKSMQVVEIGGTLYVVGVGENITLLDKITDSQTLENVLLAFEGGKGPGRPALLTEVSRLLSARNKGKAERGEDEENNWDSAAAFNDLLQTKLQGVANRKDALKKWMDEDVDMQRRSKDTP